MTRWIRFGSSVLLLLAACDTGFELRSAVTRPRILAMVASSPEAAPGEDVTVDALVFDPEGRALELRWSMCTTADVAGGFGPPGFGAMGGTADPGCDEASMFTTPLPTMGFSTVVPGTCASPAEPWRCTEGIVQLFTSIAAMGALPPDVVEQLVSTVGVTVTVNLDVYIEGEHVERGFKRIAVTRRTPPTTNPPAPRFRVGNVWVSGRGVTEPFTCVPEDGVAPVVPALAEVSLEPDLDDEAWFETFPIVGLDGTVIEGSENAFYSWFSTGGSFSPPLTVAPERETTWTTPQEPGVYPLWLVVRDGHLGMSACRVDVEVLPVVPPFGEVRRL